MSEVCLKSIWRDEEYVTVLATVRLMSINDKRLISTMEGRDVTFGKRSPTAQCQQSPRHFAAGEEKEQKDTRDAAANIIMDALKQLDDLVHRRQLEWMALDRFWWRTHANRSPLALIYLDFFSLCGLVPLPFLGLQWESRLSPPTMPLSITVWCGMWFCHQFASGWMMLNWFEWNKWQMTKLLGEYATMLSQFWSMLYRLYHFKSRRLLPGLHALLMEDDSFGHAQLADAQLMRAVSCRIQQIVWLSGNSQQ